LKPGYVRCADCGAPYKASMPHVMFCAAHTCGLCGTSYSQVLEVDPDNPEGRICDACLDNRDTALCP